jgi:putative membrane protein
VKGRDFAPRIQSVVEYLRIESLGWLSSPVPRGVLALHAAASRPRGEVEMAEISYSRAARPAARVARGFEPAAWIAIGAYCALVIAFAWDPTALAQALAATGIALAFAHAALKYGPKDALVFFVIVNVVAFAIENVGTRTGVPFGRYHFEVGAALPHVGLIPIIVGPLWFGMGYFAWIVARALLDGVARRAGGVVDTFVAPIVAAFVMTQWDLVMDAPESTISRAWEWRDGGADFGVPLSNYAGWLLTSWLFYQIFAMYSRGREAVETPTESAPFRWAPILFYASSGLAHVTPWLLGQAGEIVDGGGRAWRVADLRESAVATMIFTMLFTSGLAALRLAAPASDSAPRR